MSLFPPRHSQRGDIALYISLIILLSTTAILLTLSATTIRQLRATRDISTSERALYTAEAGVEALFYCLKKQPTGLDDMPNCDYDAVYNLEDLGWPADAMTIQYPDNQNSTYTGRYLAVKNGGNLLLCSKVMGQQRGIFRFISSRWEGLADPRCDDVSKLPSP